jgi:uncharacterized protein (DUF39 family)
MAKTIAEINEKIRKGQVNIVLITEVRSQNYAIHKTKVGAQNSNVQQF